MEGPIIFARSGWKLVDSIARKVWFRSAGLMIYVVPCAILYLVLSLVMLRYIDEAMLTPFWKWIARTGVPIAAILIPAALFLSVASPTSAQPNGLINLA